MNQIDNIMALAKEYRDAIDDHGTKRQALRAAIEQALKLEPVQRWAVFCGGCRKEWSVPYQHPGKSICAECEAKCKATPPAAPQPQQEIDWKDQYEKQKRRAEMWVAKYEKDIGPLEKAGPVTTPQPQPKQEPNRAFLERALTAMEGVIDVADRKTDEFDALRSCVMDLTLMLYSDAPQPQTKQEPVGEVLNERGEVDYFSYVPEPGAKLYTASQPQPKQEPVAYQYRMRPTWGNKEAPWGPWEECSKGKYDDCKQTPLLHDWQYEARELYTTAPQPQPNVDEIEVTCPVCSHTFYEWPQREQRPPNCGSGFCSCIECPYEQRDDTALLRQALEMTDAMLNAPWDESLKLRMVEFVKTMKERLKC